MKSFKEFLEDVAANCVGGGQVAGLGIGPNGEPGVTKKKKKNVVIATLSRRKTNVPSSINTRR